MMDYKESYPIQFKELDVWVDRKYRLKFVKELKLRHTFRSVRTFCLTINAGSSINFYYELINGNII